MIFPRPLHHLISLCALVLVLAGCWSEAAPPARADVPADAEVERLRATEPPAAAEVRVLRAQELDAGTAAAKATAAGDTATAAAQQRLAEALAALRSGAETREREQRIEIAALAADAEKRAAAEHAELDRRIADQAHQADLQHAEEARLADRRRAGWGLALAAVAGVAMRILGLPTLLAVGLPLALASGCVTLAAWSSVPWLATALGLVLAGGVAIALALIGRQLLHEWTDYAARLHAATPAGKAEADALSLARQPAWVRWVLDHLLPHAAAPATPATSAPALAPSTAAALTTTAAPRQAPAATHPPAPTSAGAPAAAQPPPAAAQPPQPLRR